MCIRDRALGGTGEHYNPNSSFTGSSEVANQEGAVELRVAYVMVGANQFVDGIPSQRTLAMFAINGEGRLMNGNNDIAALPCPPYCEVPDEN